jgi:GAF domain-containing protein
MEIGEGITGWVAKERHTVAISKNAEIDPRFTPFRSLPEDRFQAFLSTPVISRGDVIGVINVQHRKAHSHSQSEITLLTVIGHQVGSAIENARVHQDAKRKAMQIDTLARVSQTVASGQYLEEILHLIVAMTAGMMGSKICSIMLIDPSGAELKVVATQSLSDEYRRRGVKVDASFSGQAVRERRPIAVADVTRDPNYGRPEIAKREGLCSLLSVPMVVSGRAIGVINVYTGSPHHFTQEESNLLRTVANQAAISIENTRLLERIAARPPVDPPK